MDARAAYQAILSRLLGQRSAEDLAHLSELAAGVAGSEARQKDASLDQPAGDTAAQVAEAAVLRAGIPTPLPVALEQPAQQARATAMATLADEAMWTRPAHLSPEQAAVVVHAAQVEYDRWIGLPGQARAADIAEAARQRVYNLGLTPEQADAIRYAGERASSDVSEAARAAAAAAARGTGELAYLRRLAGALPALSGRDPAPLLALLTTLAAGQPVPQDKLVDLALLVDALAVLPALSAVVQSLVRGDTPGMADSRASVRQAANDTRLPAPADLPQLEDAAANMAVTAALPLVTAGRGGEALRAAGLRVEANLAILRAGGSSVALRARNAPYRRSKPYARL